MASPLTTLGLTRATLLTVITITNLASIPIMSLALTFGSGGVFQGIVLGLNILACSVPAAYWYHKAVYLGERVYTRSTTAFGLLSVIDLVSAILLLVRDSEQDGTALVNDFAMLDNSSGIAKASIALAMLSACFSIVGLGIVCLGLVWRSPQVADPTEVTDNQPRRPFICFIHSSTSKSVDDEKSSEISIQEDPLDKC
ncbi:hypothetical protein AGABI1DRAFT_111525 [Agaricus bisporus var. burnettii JB137-S8]|uniref:MARVEL domain-containing protein n=2 Tax=Agaricus bisporus var. burnettii TaxID=192524 RepID=K5X556_AGABU|nr:uncharacterized protein AGABI1DRAFT_111525 [Agaricus bisporus var. burnettii JB137-S8]EKM82996.1 hypothetical protein AGABI1DRAFT_111525 [Agaricus bisporus var. burnettii JB137-S8]KAF7777515.1 hypothetical protein Agabi119p4_3587 [Agaricus bisporus var. burnettii]